MCKLSINFLMNIKIVNLMLFSFTVTAKDARVWDFVKKINLMTRSQVNATGVIK